MTNGQYATDLETSSDGIRVAGSKINKFETVQGHDYAEDSNQNLSRQINRESWASRKPGDEQSQA